MTTGFSNSELEAFLEESLPVERMAAIEDALRHNDQLQQRLTAINGRRDAGVHSLGEIWRRHRLTCPTREQLGSYLLGVLPHDAPDSTLPSQKQGSFGAPVMHVRGEQVTTPVSEPPFPSSLAP